jgi:manganese/zinc/iron transport system permease protein
MVMMAFFFFIAAWIMSPRYGLVAGMLRRRNQRQNFAIQLILGHIFHHQNSPEAADELALSTLHQHLNWTPEKTRRLLRRVHARGFIQLDKSCIRLTERGQQQVLSFRNTNFNTN